MSAKPQFRFNTKELSEALQKEIAAMPERARKTMILVGGLLNSEIRDRTPVDEGHLTASIADEVRKYKGSYAAVMYIPVNAPSSDYAIPMHEWEYIPGENSYIKQQKAGKVAGRKYITRALYENTDTVQKLVAKQFKKFLKS